MVTLLLLPALHRGIAAAEETATLPAPLATATPPDPESAATPAAGTLSVPAEGADAEPLPLDETPITAAEAFGSESSPAGVSRLSTSTGYPHAPIYFDLGVAVCTHCKTPPGTGGVTIAFGAQRARSRTSDWTPFVAAGGEMQAFPRTIGEADPNRSYLAVHIRAGMKVPRGSVYVTGGPILTKKGIATHAAVGFASYDAFTVWPRTGWLVPLPSVVEVGVVSPDGSPGQLSPDGPVRVKVAWGF